MKKKEIYKLVFKISKNIFSSLTDLILWNIFFLTEVSPLGHPENIGRAKILADKDLEKFNSLTIKRAIARAKMKGFIKYDFTLTKEGEERLKSIFPKYFGEKKWKGEWYLVIYDIPESKRKYRGILRENLKRLGFGQLQASCWISPFNFLGEIEKIVKDYNLSQYVIVAITDKLGKEEARILANKVWNLEKINKFYKNLLRGFENKNVAKKKLYFRYLNILKKDPQLPKNLLPEDWKGKEAWRIFKTRDFLKIELKGKK